MASISNMHDEMKDIEDVAARITSDCVLFRDKLTEAREIVHDQMIEPLTRYIDEFDITLKAKFDRIVEEVGRKLDEYRNAIGPDNQNKVIQDANTILHRWWNDMNANLLLLKNERRLEVMKDINVTHDGALQIYKSYLEPLRTYISQLCERCMNANNDPLVEIQKMGLTAALMNVLANYNELLSALPIAWNTWIKDFTLVAEAPDSNAIISQLQDIQVIMEGIRDSLLKERNATYAGIEFIDASLEFVWREQCQVGITRVFSVYSGDHSEVKTLLNETHAYIVEQDDTWQSYYVEYFEGNQTSLQTVGVLFQFDNIQSFISRKETRLETSLNRRKMAVEGVREQVGNINYLLLAMLQRDWISSRSTYISGLFKSGSPSPTSPSDIQVETTEGWVIDNLIRTKQPR